jgi:hypothetical protein
LCAGVQQSVRADLHPGVSARLHAGDGDSVGANRPGDGGAGVLIAAGCRGVQASNREGASGAVACRYVSVRSVGGPNFALRAANEQSDVAIFLFSAASSTGCLAGTANPHSAQFLPGVDFSAAAEAF